MKILGLAGVVLPFLGACVPATVSGLRPVYPTYPAFRVDGLQPTLQWEAFPTADDPPWLSGRVTEVTYDLKILQGGWEVFETVVYSREGLKGPEHTVEAPLRPSEAYAWSVRARFKLDGHPRMTQWTELSGSEARRALTPVPTHSYLPLRTP